MRWRVKASHFKCLKIVRVLIHGCLCRRLRLTFVDTFVRCINLLPDMPLLGSSNATANKDMTWKIWTNGETLIWLSRKHCGKRRNCSLWAISSFPTMFSRAVCFSCIKMSIYGEKTWDGTILMLLVQSGIKFCIAL